VCARLDHRFMDWKRSAKHRKLLTREFRTERKHPVVLASTRPPHAGADRGRGALDHAIEAGLLLGWISLRTATCRRFRLRRAGAAFLKPGSGMPYFARLQRAGRHADYRTEETNFTLGLAELDARLNRRTLVVLFTGSSTPSRPSSWWKACAAWSARHIVCSSRCRTDGGPADGGRAGPLSPPSPRPCWRTIPARALDRCWERIAASASTASTRRRATSSAGLLNQYLTIKQRGLI